MRSTRQNGRTKSRQETVDGALRLHGSRVHSHYTFGTRNSGTVRAADKLMLFKYVVRNVDACSDGEDSLAWPT